jgi:hypothetical protein
VTGSRRATSFLSIIASAASWLGAVLAVLWLALWGLQAAGGPGLGMPIEVLRGAAALIVIGTILRLVLRPRAVAKKEA